MKPESIQRPEQSRRLAAVPAPAGDPAYTALPTPRERAFAREALLSLLPAVLFAALLAVWTGTQRPAQSVYNEIFMDDEAAHLYRVSVTVDGTELGPQALPWCSVLSPDCRRLRVETGDPERAHVIRVDSQARTWRAPGRATTWLIRNTYRYDPISRQWRRLRAEHVLGAPRTAFPLELPNRRTPLEQGALEYMQYHARMEARVVVDGVDRGLYPTRMETGPDGRYSRLIVPADPSRLHVVTVDWSSETGNGRFLESMTFVYDPADRIWRVASVQNGVSIVPGAMSIYPDGMIHTFPLHLPPDQ